ncbi:MAG TPA: type II secretion system protein GspG [Myxococcota bacterium]|nr:type II secretion system protein GspG [Myxococcota bacterium]
MAPQLTGSAQQQPQSTLRSWLVGALLTCAITLGALFVIRWVRPSALSGVLAHSSTVEVRRGRALIDIKWIQEALLVYAHEHNGAYPEQLAALVLPKADGKTYFGERREVPLDPWNRAFGYEPPTTAHTNPRITTLGADGKPGGDGENADIDSDTLQLDR